MKKKTRSNVKSYNEVIKSLEKQAGADLGEKFQELHQN